MTHPIRSLLFLAALLSLAPEAFSQATVAAPAWPKPKPTSHDYSRWEKTIAAFEEEDKRNPPPKGAVLFVGSSTIVRWKTLAADFPGTTVLNRGFGGNQIKDSTHFAERMIFPYEPKAIFLRAGGNDISAGWPAADVFADFKAFVAKMRSRFPGIPIAYIGLSPTIKRWEQVDEGNRLNDLIKSYCEGQEGLTFIECRETTLGPDGKPRPELFVGDNLHFSPAGYKILAEAVRPHLPKGSP